MTQENDGWLMIGGDAEGEKKVYRVRLDAPAGVEKSEFANCVILEWRYDESGLPDLKTTALHKAFEALMDPLNERSGNSVLMHVYTGGGIKEWCYYARDYDRYMEELNRVLTGAPRFPIEILYDSDATWKYWGAIRELATSNASA